LLPLLLIPATFVLIPDARMTDDIPEVSGSSGETVHTERGGEPDEAEDTQGLLEPLTPTGDEVEMKAY